MDTYDFARVFRAGLRAKELERRETRAYLVGSAVTAGVMLALFFVALVSA